MPKVTTDSHGFVRGFPYHDGFFDGLLMNNQRDEAQLALRAVSGEWHTLTLRRVVALEVQGLRQGSIILDIGVLPLARAVCDEELRLKLADGLGLGLETLPEDAHVFWLYSSCGAEVIAVCGDVEVRLGTLVP